MTTCWECGEEIEFRMIDGEPRPINHHCSGYTAGGTGWDSGSGSGDDWPVGRFRWGGHNSDFRRPSKCPLCGDPVHFVRHNGGSVWFDPPLGPPWPIHGCFAGKEHPRQIQRTLAESTSRAERVSVGVVLDAETTRNRSVCRLAIRCSSGTDFDQDFGFEGHAPSVPGCLVFIGFNKQVICWIRFWNPRFSVSNHVERAVRIRLEGGDCGVLDTAVCHITAELQAVGGVIHGPYPIPSRHERYTILSASGRRVYTVITHKRLLSLINARSEVIARLGSLTLPPELSVRLAENTGLVEHRAAR